MFNHVGGRGKASSDPHFQVELPSGIKISVRDWGFLPESYRGPIVLEVREGNVSGRPIYRIDEDRTSAMHNNHGQ